jgi:hypothetical protein
MPSIVTKIIVAFSLNIASHHSSLAEKAEHSALIQAHIAPVPPLRRLLSLPLPLCRGDQYASGSWVPISAAEVIRKRERFKCCPSRLVRNEFAECIGGDTGERGPLLFDIYNRSGIYPNQWGNACVCAEIFANRRNTSIPRNVLDVEDMNHTYILRNETAAVDEYGEILPFEKFEWRPSTCELMTWNATRFCELLGPNRTKQQRRYSVRS